MNQDVKVTILPPVGRPKEGNPQVGSSYGRNLGALLGSEARSGEARAMKGHVDLLLKVALGEGDLQETARARLARKRNGERAARRCRARARKRNGL